MKVISLLVILEIRAGLGTSSSGEDPNHTWRAPQDGEGTRTMLGGSLE